VKTDLPHMKLRKRAYMLLVVLYDTIIIQQLGIFDFQL